MAHQVGHFLCLAWTEHFLPFSDTKKQQGRRETCEKTWLVVFFRQSVKGVLHRKRITIYFCVKLDLNESQSLSENLATPSPHIPTSGWWAVISAGFCIWILYLYFVFLYLYFCFGYCRIEKGLVFLPQDRQCFNTFSIHAHLSHHRKDGLLPPWCWCP